MVTTFLVFEIKLMSGFIAFFALQTCVLPDFELTRNIFS